MDDPYVRPATPQAMVHRLPDRPATPSAEATKPTKFIVLISASSEVAGKVQIARTVSTALSCPLFQGDSLHETAARAARAGAPARTVDADRDDTLPEANEPRYQRMWLSKMTRTGLLFPQESRPANSGFSGFGGSSSTSSSRRGSASSTDMSDDATGSVSSMASSVTSSPAAAPAYVNKPPMRIGLEDTKLGKSNGALMVLTHPELESWHKYCITQAISEYGIGIIFVPLDEDQEPPVLRPLDPRTMTNFTSFDDQVTARRAVRPNWSKELVLVVDVKANVEDIAEEIIDGARDIMNA